MSEISGGIEITQATGRVVPITAKQVARFWSGFQTAPSGCLEWTGRQNWKGYGRFIVYRGRQRAYVAIHRLAWTIAFGPIPDRMTVDHRCFNLLCGNPAHLRLLTLEENARERRSYRFDQCPHGHMRTADNIHFERRRDKIHRRCKTCHLREQWRFDQKRRGKAA